MLQKSFFLPARKILIINHFVIPEIKRVIRGNACLGKRPFGEMSFVELSIGKMPVRGIVPWRPVYKGNCLSGNVFGELPVGEISVGQKFTGEMFKLLWLLQIGNISSLFIFCLTETKCTIYDTAPSVMW